MNTEQAQEIQSTPDALARNHNGSVLPNQNCQSSKKVPQRLEWVQRFPEALKFHPALTRLKLLHSVFELARANRLRGLDTASPILITTKGTIIGGFSEWDQAISDSRPIVDCLEFPMTDE